MKKYFFLVALPARVALTFLLCSFGAHAAPTIYYSGNDVIYTVTPPGPKTLFATLPTFTSPQGLAFDTSGNLFVAGGGNVSKITPAGGVSLFANLPPGSFGGYGMAIDAGNNLYVAGAATVQIVQITPAGTVSVYATLTSGSTGLAIDSIGNLYALGGNTVKKIPAGGGAASDYVTLPSNNLYGLAFDSFGYLYVSDLTLANLYKIPPGGGSYTPFGTLIAGSDGLAFDGSGNLYAAHLFADAISVITPDGTASVFATGLSGPRYLAFKPAMILPPFVLRITSVDKIGNDFRVSCNSELGKSYELQSRLDLLAGDWASLPGTTTSGTGGTLQITATNGFSQSQQFYRVRELP